MKTVIILLSITFVILVAVELLYIPIAKKNNWTSQRDLRPDGQPVTVVGGGIIFYIAMVLWSIGIGWIYNLNDIGSNFIVGLTMLAACSFADDLLQLRVWIRLVVQLMAVFFLCFQFQIFAHSSWVIIAFIICTIGFVNGYNFMDGINGLTAAYSIVVLGIMLYINLDIVHFTSGVLISMALLSVIIFAFFNFRRHAIVFAGDIGAICMGYIVATILTSYILFTHDLTALIFVMVYGVDIVLTIFRRLVRGENIFMPHQKHLYQNICNVWHANQLVVATVYSLLQAVISITYLTLEDSEQRITCFFIVAGVLTTLYFLGIWMSARKRKA